MRRKEAKSMCLERAVPPEQVRVETESAEPEHGVAQIELRRVVRGDQIELAVCADTYADI